MKYVAFPRYKFHRLLCPRFQLALAERWPKEINSDIFNGFFSYPTETVNEISKFFIKNIPPTIRTDLSNFEVKESETKSNKV